MKVETPIGPLWLCSDGAFLTAVRFTMPENDETDEVCRKAARWLKAYFAGEDLPVTVPIRCEGTDFQKAVWALLPKIPYGKTTTYGALARRLAETLGRRVSARAVGGALNKNPLPLLLPCHRVIGADGKLTGYAGGTEKKAFLLEMERTHGEK